MGSMTQPGGTEKPGDIKYHAANAIPYGWLKANGAAVSRTAYAALFGVIGTTFGAGDGATTFNLPELRGEFPRGFDDGRGVDSGRVFGSAQAGDVQSHTHAVIQNISFARGSTFNALGAVDYDAQAAAQTAATGGTETRPRNVALLACIKF